MMTIVNVEPMSSKDDQIRANLAQVRAKIARSAMDSGRMPQAVQLVCVTKGQETQFIRAALDSGERVFGENRVQEALRKWPALKTEHPDVELHLIGPLQTNKVREALAFFDVIETLDRPRLADALAREIRATGYKPKLFIQVNTGREPQKAGVEPQDADEFINYCRVDRGLDISGLMCIPPAAEQASPHFALLASIAARNAIPALSMGMSGDYELAIQLGATHVRVGSAIFGMRPQTLPSKDD